MKKLIIGALLAFSTTISYAQLDFGTILEGNVADANRYAEGYLEPLAVGFGQGINGGWYSTAKTHKFLGLDIKVIASGAIVPSEKESFTFNNSDYGSIKLDDSSLSQAQLPTILGSKELSDRPLLEFSSNGGSISTSSLPGFNQIIKDNIGLNAVPSSMVQVGLGLFKNTDLKVRFIPKQTIDDNEFSVFGIGIMHDIKQWIPGVKLLPFHLSAFGGYTNIKSAVLLDASNNPDQVVELDTNSYMFQLVASKKLAFLTVFGGVGTTSYKSDLSVLGVFNTSNTDTPIVDPITLNYTGSNLRANLGIDIKLLFLNISAEYAVQEYDTLTATVGFSIR